MFKCSGKCNTIGIHTIVLLIISLCLLIYYFICSINSNNCNILLIFSMIFLGLFLIYLYVWYKTSTKKTKIHPIIKKKGFKPVKNSEKKYIFFEQKKDISFDQIII